MRLLKTTAILENERLISVITLPFVSFFKVFRQRGARSSAATWINSYHVLKIK